MYTFLEETKDTSPSRKEDSCPHIEEQATNTIRKEIKYLIIIF
jgi:DNA-dependent RNA polymerase auxiliary subunit epsilon